MPEPVYCSIHGFNFVIIACLYFALKPFWFFVFSLAPSHCTHFHNKPTPKFGFFPRYTIVRTVFARVLMCVACIDHNKYAFRIFFFHDLWLLFCVFTFVVYFVFFYCRALDVHVARLSGVNVVRFLCFYINSRFFSSFFCFCCVYQQAIDFFV